MRSRFAALYRHHFRDHRRERMFLASLSFFATFAVTRALLHASRARGVSFEVHIGGVHVHHLVWGILLLLVVGYLWLIQLGSGANGSSVWFGRLTAVLYGLGAALTLDEFALWLNLRDVYWESEGRASVEVALMFGGLVSAGLWGGPFLRASTRQLMRVIRRHVPHPELPSLGEPAPPLGPGEPPAGAVHEPVPEVVRAP